jgi:predicted DsbA family dithiol-disulfide isomerase
MPSISPPPGHTPEGGVLLGRVEARRQLVLFEDPQCPWCRKFEQTSGDLVRREIAAGAISAEFRMRCFLGPESVRADNALVLAAGEGRFDPLLRQVFDNQPEEGTGGFTADVLITLGAAAGLGHEGYRSGVRGGVWEGWVIEREVRFAIQSPNGTPTLVLDGETVPSPFLDDPDALGQLLRA